MGYYLNPTDMPKELWLEQNAEGHREPFARHYDPETDRVAVCLVDNGMFTAAGVAYNQEELRAFARPDGRPKTWWWAPAQAVIDMTGVKIEGRD